MRGRGGLFALGAAVALLAFVVLHPRRQQPPVPAPPAPDAPASVPASAAAPAQAAAQAPAPAAAPIPAARPPGSVRGRVIGRYGTILGVTVRVVVDGAPTAETRSDFDGAYRLEAPAGVQFTLEAVPDPWTELKPMRRKLTVDPRAEIVEDLVLAAGAGASGHIEGPAAGEPVRLLAIRAEDYPLSGDRFPIAAFERTPRLATEAIGTFTFTDLDPAVTYRLAVDGYEWGLTRPVFLDAGDTGVGVPLERLLHFVVAASDIEGSGLLTRFVVKVVDRSGKTYDRLEGHDGRLEHCARHPEQVPPDPPPLDDEAWRRILKQLESGTTIDASWPAEHQLPPWTLTVEAEGYFEGKGAPSGVQRVFLQRIREPDVLLHVRWEDGSPCDGDLDGTFEAAEQPDGVAEARVTRDGPGTFHAVLPPGGWTLRLSPRGDRHGSMVYVPVDVPASGVVTVESPRIQRGD